MIAAFDPDALLVALVLCPGAYSRNRFYSMYAMPELSAVRRRAAQVRSIVAELAHIDPLRRGKIVSVDHVGVEGHHNVAYVVPSLGLRRSSLLTALELAIVQYAITRRLGSIEGLDAGDGPREQIEQALRGLSPDMADSARRALEDELFDNETEETVLQDAHHEE